LREAGGAEARGNGSNGDGDVSAAGVANVMEPTVCDVEGQENTAGAEDAEDLGESGVLRGRRIEMVKHENGDDRGERLGHEGEARSIATNGVGAAVGMRLEFAERVEVVFERCDVGDAGQEMRGGRTVASTDFEEAVAKICVRDDPGKEFAAGETAPEGGGAEEMFEGVHDERKV
jgi:hypothetical protein